MAHTETVPVESLCTEVFLEVAQNELKTLNTSSFVVFECVQKSKSIKAELCACPLQDFAEKVLKKSKNE